MDGSQKTVALGLQTMARWVEEGKYGLADDFASDDLSEEAFRQDMDDEVFDKMD